MTASELKALRLSLGLTTSWLADQALVSRQRVAEWEIGTAQVPDTIANILRELDEKMELLAYRTFREALEKNTAVDIGQPIELTVYQTNQDLWAANPKTGWLPAMVHAAILERTRRKLEQTGRQVQMHIRNVAAPTL